MKVILAQGNPGAKYAKTRHNVGFWLLDEYATQKNLHFKEQAKFFAHIAEFTHGQEKVWLVKPNTFYNETGKSARKITDFYKLSAEDFLVIHDDLALPMGTLRTRLGGSSAGNNGIKSLNTHLGENTARLRVGTFSEKLTSNNLTNVLSRFTLSEKRAIKRQLPVVIGIVDQFIAGSLDETTYR